MLSGSFEPAEKPGNNGKRWDLFEFLEYLRYKLKWLIIPVVLCTALAVMYACVIAKPEYEGVAEIYVVNSRDSAVDLSDLQIGSYLTSDYQYIFQTWEVNQQVINNLQLPYTVKEMRERLTVQNPSNTRILKIIFASPSGREAAVVANEYAEVASQYISDLMLTAKPTIISTALEPLLPARPRKTIIVGAGFVLSVLMTAWCLFVAFLFDDKIKTSADLKKLTSLEPLAVIPPAQGAAKTNRRKGW